MRQAILFMALVACGGGSEGVTETKPDDDSAWSQGACVTDTGGGYPTWAGFGEAFFAGRCASCHAVSAPERFGAPEGVNFDTEDEVIGQLDAVQRVILDNATMPPGGGLHEDELRLMQAYLDCLRELSAT